jgi:isoleucyl-tRNA synthetase
MFKNYKKLDLQKIFEEINQYWKDHKIFQKSVYSRNGKKLHVFYEGPPSANGMPGIHHLISRTIKDIFCRYHTLKGKQVKRRAGWDTHGLPIELSVEKSLGIAKEDVGKKISIESYNKACKKSVMHYTKFWKKITEKIGYWVDLNEPYITFESKYIESIWWSLKKLYKKGFLYKGYSVQPYSPTSGTTLSYHELSLPGSYKEITDTALVVKFKAIKNSLPENFQKIVGDIFFLSWTTTPWTLPSNTAIGIGPKIDYVIIKTYNPYTFLKENLILSKNRIWKLFKKIPYKILKEFKGYSLIGSRYEQLLSWVLPSQGAEKAFKVIQSDLINTNEGSGIVHIAPTFGVEDSNVAKQNGIPSMLVRDEKSKKQITLVDLQGRFIKNLPKGFGGEYVKKEYSKNLQRSVDDKIAELLKSENRVFSIEKYTHYYPHCWRMEKPLLYYPLDSWFIKTSKSRRRMVELNKSINWNPKTIGENRFGKWLENINDWNLSRSRFWGVPLPIWSNETSGEEMIIGSVEELVNEIEKSIQKKIMKENPFKNFVTGDMSPRNYKQIDLHKHVVDKIILVSTSGFPMKREPYLIDVWFDSGAMPFAQWHYPFENSDFIRKEFPADFIAEGVDQTRGWFYSLHAISCMLFDSISYKNVVVNGLILDNNGQKMSKSRGNTIDPFEIIDKFGPDVTRWYLVSNTSFWENIRFNTEGIEDVKKKFFGTLYNSYTFFTIYANIDGFSFQEKSFSLEKLTEVDRWILSELNNLIQKVDKYYSDYDPTKVVRELNKFVIDNLSNWYIRICRKRFWKETYNNNKISAYQTLYHCLFNVSKLISPIAPFFSDRLYQDLNKITNKETFESVHLSNFPIFNPEYLDEDLQERMDLGKKISSMVFSLRKKNNIKVRQPLQKLIIITKNERIRKQLKLVSRFIAKEVNVKKIEVSDPSVSILIKQISPSYKKLGPKFKKSIKKITNVIEKFTPSDIVQIEKKGKKEIFLEGKKLFIHLEDVLISTKEIPGFSVFTDPEKNFTVALDVSVTNSLKQEGLARSFVNKVQNLRKQKGFHITDKIIMYIDSSKEFIDSSKEFIDSSKEFIDSSKEFIDSSKEFIEALEKNKNSICEETLSVDLILYPTFEWEGEEVKVEGFQSKIAIMQI